MFRNIPVVVKNIIIINVLFWLASQVWPVMYALFGGHYYLSPEFGPWQIITHMFMHASAPNFAHLFFNMYGLFIFGSLLEQVWGPKRFLIYYLVSGIGAFFLHMLINHIEVQQLMAQLGGDAVDYIKMNGLDLINQGQNWSEPAAWGQLNAALHGTIVGASGCVFGVLLAFGLLFPNVELMLLFPPIPIKAKWFVFGYGAIEFFLAMRNAPGDSVAHYAHLGGMLFGYILLKLWQRNGVKLN
ncbi:MAG: rhomboid family intramembrane serine protease [Flavobacteriales bacterium]|nr:rhomboid family intramembrane serine protease [Flavobacteriales bacterium]